VLFIRIYPHSSRECLRIQHERHEGHKGLRKTRENPRKSANSAVEACPVECLNLSDCGLFVAAVTKALSGEPLQRMASREDSFDIIEQMCGSLEILEV
jgi:hypothetical protein